jgi:hypothetical protein
MIRRSQKCDQLKQGGTMSVSQAIKHARAVRQRLRYPRNAVKDHGIDLKRKPEEPSVVVELPPAPPVELPLGVGTPLPDYELVYALNLTVPASLSIRTIQCAVCQHYGVSLADLCSRRRDTAIVLPRQVAVWLCRRLTTHSMPAIGHHFGGRDHTTILHAARRVDELRQSDAVMQGLLDAFITALSLAGRTSGEGA